MGQLTALKVKSLKEPGRYQDGDGLMLLIKSSGARSWVLRIQIEGKRRDFGLGSANVVTLAEARDKALEYRRLCRQGIDPVAVKAAEARNRKEPPSFADAARTVHAERSPGWKNAKSVSQWITSLERYAFPAIGSIKVNEISATDIRDLLAGIWLEKPETARRVRQRIAAVLDWAHAMGWRDSEAPLRSISKGLPRQVRITTHLPAMPYEVIPGLMKQLRDRDTIGRLGLRFTILTAARSGETRGAKWKEFDLDAGIWTIPAARMKAGKVHVAPLSEATVEILNIARQIDNSPEAFVFLGTAQRMVSDMTLTKALRDAGVETYTVHGFRSSFRDWAAEQTIYPGEVVEAALAHTNPNRVEAAYRRTNFLEKRVALMEAWASFVMSEV